MELNGIEYIELNMRNYSDNDIGQLNAWAIEAYAEIARLRAENAELKKYEQCLEDAARRLQDVLPIGKVKAIGLLEVPAGIDELTTVPGKLATLKHENNKLRKANERLNAAMKAGEIEIELCNDCGCDVATWNSSNAAMCVDCCMCEEEQ